MDEPPSHSDTVSKFDTVRYQRLIPKYIDSIEKSYSRGLIHSALPFIGQDPPRAPEGTSRRRDRAKALEVAESQGAH